MIVSKPRDFRKPATEGPENMQKVFELYQNMTEDNPTKPLLGKVLEDMVSERQQDAFDYGYGEDLYGPPYKENVDDVLNRQGVGPGIQEDIEMSTPKQIQKGPAPKQSVAIQEYPATTVQGKKDSGIFSKKDLGTAIKILNSMPDANPMKSALGAKVDRTIKAKEGAIRDMSDEASFAPVSGGVFTPESGREQSPAPEGLSNPDVGTTDMVGTAKHYDIPPLLLRKAAADTLGVHAVPGLPLKQRQMRVEETGSLLTDKRKEANDAALSEVNAITSTTEKLNKEAAKIFTAMYDKMKQGDPIYTSKAGQDSILSSMQNIKYIQSREIDPVRYWRRMPEVVGVLTAFGAGMAGVASGWFGRPNQVLDNINKAIDRDIGAQIQNKKAEIAGAKLSLEEQKFIFETQRDNALNARKDALAMTRFALDSLSTQERNIKTRMSSLLLKHAIQKQFDSLITPTKSTSVYTYEEPKPEKGPDPQLGEEGVKVPPKEQSKFVDDYNKANNYHKLRVLEKKVMDKHGWSKEEYTSKLAQMKEGLSKWFSQTIGADEDIVILKQIYMNLYIKERTEATGAAFSPKEEADLKGITGVITSFKNWLPGVVGPLLQNKINTTVNRLNSAADMWPPLKRIKEASSGHTYYDKANRLLREDYDPDNPTEDVEPATKSNVILRGTK